MTTPTLCKHCDPHPIAHPHTNDRRRQALRTEARARARDIQWAAALLPKLLDGVAALATKSEALRAQVLC